MVRICYVKTRRCRREPATTATRRTPHQSNRCHGSAAVAVEECYDDESQNTTKESTTKETMKREPLVSDSPNHCHCRRCCPPERKKEKDYDEDDEDEDEE